MCEKKKFMYHKFSETFRKGGAFVEHHRAFMLNITKHLWEISKNFQFKIFLLVLINFFLLNRPYTIRTCKVQI